MDSMRSIKKILFCFFGAPLWKKWYHDALPVLSQQDSDSLNFQGTSQGPLLRDGFWIVGSHQKVWLTGLLTLLLDELKAWINIPLNKGLFYQKQRTFCRNFFAFMIVLIGFSKSVHASFLNNHAEGWHWYEDKKDPEDRVEEEETEENPKPSLKEEVSSHTQKLKALQKELQERRDRAVIEPTYAHVKSYQALQKVMVDHADKFAKIWLQVLYTSPELDTTLENPTAQPARHVYLDQEQKMLEQKVKALSQSYGLFFFFKKGCAYCHHFAPIVKQFSERFGWKVLAISLDGGTLPEFPEVQMDNGSAEKLHITSVPALMAVNPKTGHVLPLSFGMTTQDQIMERIKVLMEKSPT